MTSKWVFKIKHNQDGSINRHKACLVAKGFNQLEGNCVAPVPKLVTVRLFLALAVASNQPIHQLDINYAYLRSYDHCLFIKNKSAHFLALIIYVDDILISGLYEADIAATKSFLDTIFSIKDLGYVKFFLGLKIARSFSRMYLSQQKYILDIINDFQLQNL